MASKKKARATISTGVAYVPPQTAQAAQGTPLATPSPANTFVAAPAPYDPIAAAQANLGTLLAPVQNTADTNYGTALAQSLAGEGTFANRIGATLGARAPGLDPAAATSGSFDWGNVQAANPFSDAALLQRHYQQAQRGAVNGLAAQGQLYSGAMRNAQGENTFSYQQGQNTLQNQLYDYLTGQSSQRAGALNAKNQTISDAAFQALTALLGSS